MLSEARERRGHPLEEYSRPGRRQDTKVEVLRLGWGWASSRAGEGRETEQLKTNWQPVRRTQAGRAVTARRRPASGAPDTASSRTPQSSSQQKSHLGLLAHFPAQEPGCAASFPDLTGCTRQNSRMFSRCYLPAITWQQATGRRSNSHPYFHFCFLEIKFLRKNSESEEKKS